MALLLSGERPSAAAILLNPLRLLAAWIGKVRAANARRQAFGDLLELPPHRLQDMGITRTDLFDALASDPARGSRLLQDRRARRAAVWRNL